MALTNLDSYINAVKSEVRWGKTASRTTVASIPFSLFDIAGFPGAGTLAVGNTANGVKHTDDTAGYPILPTPSGAFYLTRMEFGSSVACRLALFDRVFSAGAYAYNADITLASQPSFSDRVQNSNYKNLELWLEAVTAFTGNLSAQINYLDQDGGAGDTGVVTTGAALIVGRMFRMPLAAGDNGIQQITRVRGSVATVGTFNVHVMRRLWSAGRVKIANDGDIHPFTKTGWPWVPATAALFGQVQADSTASGLPEMTIELSDA